MNGLAAFRARDCLTSAAGSRKDSGAHPGRGPVAASICALNSSSVNVSMPEAGSLSWVHHGRRLVELVLRGGRYAIRLRDPSAETRTEFEGVSTFPVSQEWVLQGCCTPFDEPRIVRVGRYGGTCSSPPFSWAR